MHTLLAYMQMFSEPMEMVLVSMEMISMAY